MLLMDKLLLLILAISGSFSQCGNAETLDFGTGGDDVTGAAGDGGTGGDDVATGGTAGTGGAGATTSTGSTGGAGQGGSEGGSGGAGGSEPGGIGAKCDVNADCEGNPEGWCKGGVCTKPCMGNEDCGEGAVCQHNAAKGSWCVLP